MRTGGVEPPKREATALQAGELTSCSAFARTRAADRIRTGTSGAHDPGCSTVTPRPPRSGDDRTRTGGLSVDNRLLFSSELRPLGSSAGGIRTHGLELMRLARTATPLPRRSAWLESNQRSPVPDTGGVAISPTGRSRSSIPPAGFEPAASRLRAGRHLQVDHEGVYSSGGRARTCASRLTVACLTARPHRIRAAVLPSWPRQESNPRRAD
jgi:hypothetical protein